MRRIQAYDLIGLLKEENIRMDLIEENSTKSYQVYQDNYNVVYLFSYDTLIMMVSNERDVFISGYSGYSSTTSKHQGKFIAQYVDKERQDYIRKKGFKFFANNENTITKDLIPYVKYLHELKKNEH